VRYPRGRGGPGIRHLIDRRGFLGISIVAALAPRALARAAAPGAALASALERSPFVYVSPLRSDGSESRCHAEVWFAWLDGAVVLNTAAAGWKARALAAGLERARVWVGDHSPWKGALGTSEGFRAAPSFDARGAIARDADLSGRLVAEFERKYPAEFGRWRDRMREGVLDGSRVLIRYTPL